MALNKLGRKDFALAVKTGGNANDQLKFAKEASRGELFFNSNDNKLYIASTDAGAGDATLKEIQLSDTAVPFVNNYSLGLDGVDDYATLDSTFSSITGDKSITGWFRFDNTSQNAVFGNTASQYGWLFWASNTIFFRTSAATNNFTLSTTLATNTWYHIAFTGDGTTLKCYINGTQEGGDKTDGNWSIGDFFRGGTSYYFDGDVDEIGLWTGTELSASNVLAIANTGAGSGSKAVDLDAYTGLTHWWRFGDGDSGTTVTDNKGSNNLTLVNGPTFVSQTP
jgi:hypothetical protein